MFTVAAINKNTKVLQFYLLIPVQESNSYYINKCQLQDTFFTENNTINKHGDNMAHDKKSVTQKIFTT